MTTCDPLGVVCHLIEGHFGPCESDLEARNSELEAQCAAMREALSLSNYFIADQYWADTNTVIRASLLGDIILKALAPDAGKALLERLEKAERQAEEWRLRYDRALARAEKAEATSEDWRKRLCEKSDSDNDIWEQGYEKGEAHAFEEAARMAEHCLELERPETIPDAIRALGEK